MCSFSVGRDVVLCSPPRRSIQIQIHSPFISPSWIPTNFHLSGEGFIRGVIRFPISQWLTLRSDSGSCPPPLSTSRGAIVNQVDLRLGRIQPSVGHRVPPMGRWHDSGSAVKKSLACSLAGVFTMVGPPSRPIRGANCTFTISMAKE